MATLKVSSSVPSPLEDADQLRTAFEGWGTNEDLIISILAHRSVEQKKQIRQAGTSEDFTNSEILKVKAKNLNLRI
ncbi:unnamed protein product [Arabis nemorensis]|uniref:Annexin n=1 Tax=Arabis nemorensis TaxID=586526 RepID=A0A565CQT1_9BRAS|nr:unnamed protein product [Arabis nemorensis]